QRDGFRFAEEARLPVAAVFGERLRLRIGDPDDANSGPHVIVGLALEICYRVAVNGRGAVSTGGRGSAMAMGASFEFKSATIERKGGLLLHQF
ncbi:MAG TPA: hypothetical protein VHB99_06660, partial [Pirellulales bacterium]|nr:hypothetical protein [Pirellulales bacterium]